MNRQDEKMDEVECPQCGLKRITGFWAARTGRLCADCIESRDKYPQIITILFAFGHFDFNLLERQTDPVAAVTVTWSEELDESTE
jgi:hypothetical protein